MKDKRLEEQFNGYFEGVTTPELPNNIVADAKKSVKRRDTRLPRFAKIASIAASFVLVFAVAAVLIARADFSVNAPDGSADGSLGGSAALPTYGVSELRYDEENAYALSSVDGNLKFIEKLAYLNNADVQRVYTSRFANEDTAHVYAEATYVASTRYDLQIFVEFSDKTFEPLKTYADGAAGTYRGISYYLTKEIAENGEPVNKLLAVKGGVKYYFNVQSSDENAYIKCLELLLRN